MIYNWYIRGNVKEFSGFVYLVHLRVAPYHFHQIYTGA